MPSTSANAISANAAKIAHNHILPSSMIYTDEFSIYKQFDGRTAWIHVRVNHSAGVYVDGDVTRKPSTASGR